MDAVVYLRTYPAPPLSLSEVLRYAGAGGSDQADLVEMAGACARMAEGQLSYRVCWRTFPVTCDGDALDLGFARTDSRALRRCLAGCEEIVLFAATVGIGIDRLIARYEAVSPARALMLQALGAERIEALCDAFCADLAARYREMGKVLRPRFSPGYGDLPLETQRDVFRALDCPRKIGLTLNDSLLMSPTKSVTAIVGVGRGLGRARGGCAGCTKTDCEYRKG